MADLVEVDALWRVRELWLSAAADALAECERPVGRLLHAPGLQPAWDECCDGMLYTRVGAIGVMTTAQSAGDSYRHPRRLRAEVSCGVLRCAATLGENGEPPEPDAITTDAAVVEQDMWAVLEALRAVDRDYQVLGWRPLGPSGGCAGGEWSALVVLPPCTGCVSLAG